jgi:hypothetical protein
MNLQGNRFVRVGLMIFAIIGIASCAWPLGKRNESAMHIQRDDISPDGSLLLVEFVHPQRGVQTALYGWRKEKLTVLQATVPEAGNVPGAYALYTIEPVKLWDEDIDGTGNAGDGTAANDREWRVRA